MAKTNNLEAVNASEKLKHRFNIMMEAIDVFSQNFEKSFIYEFAADYFCRLLNVEHCIIYIADEKSLRIYNTRVSLPISEELQSFPLSAKLEDFAILRGSIATPEEFGAFIPDGLVDQFKTEKLILFTTQAKVDAVMLIPPKENDTHYDSYELLMIDTLTKLVNNSLEKYLRFHEVKQFSKDLDDKLFSLKALNQQSKILFSNLKLESLLKISIDSFLEISQAFQAAFIIENEMSNTYNIGAFKNVLGAGEWDQPFICSLNASQAVDPHKVLLDLQNPYEFEYFKALFPITLGAIEDFGARYIVLVLNNVKIIGFIVLSDTVTGRVLEKSQMEVLESMVINTFIAISNAKLYLKEVEHNRMLTKQLSDLHTLNEFIKNINSSNNATTLMEIVGSTLEYAYNVDKAFIALFNKDTQCLEIKNNIHADVKFNEFCIPSSWNTILEGNVIHATTSDNISIITENLINDDIASINELIVQPIYISQVDTNLIGVICIYGYRNFEMTNSEFMLHLEILSHHIAPFLNVLLSSNTPESPQLDISDFSW